MQTNKQMTETIMRERERETSMIDRVVIWKISGNSVELHINLIKKFIKGKKIAKEEKEKNNLNDKIKEPEQPANWAIQRNAPIYRTEEAPSRAVRAACPLPVTHHTLSV